MRERKKIGVLLGLTLMTVYGCQSNPRPPCDCGYAEKELRHYSENYIHELADNGILRQQLAACQEKKP